MFDHAFLEWFTGSRPRTLAFIYAPLSAWFAWDALARGWSAPATALLFAAGVLTWTLIEYLMHRFLFHRAPRGARGVVLAYLIHGVHHAFPEDRRRWLMPPAVSLPVAAGFFVIFTPLLGPAFAPVYAGGLAGYLAYDLVHYAVHANARWLPRSLRRHHLAHHFGAPESRFGVSTRLWDRVLGT
jgi:sterol desaturase/sphingolipid hydroxylase (fatty acid hydroxylase superfamily)